MISRLKSSLAAYHAREQSRAAMRQLARADDRFLRDLGIHRSDIPSRVLGIDPRF